MSKLYLYVDHYDAYEPVHSFPEGHQSLHKTLEEAEAQNQLQTRDWWSVFQIDTDAMTVTLVSNDEIYWARKRACDVGKESLMNTIYKYELKVTDDQWLEVPNGAQILDVETQRNMLFLWALVDPTAPKVRRRFRIHGTGQAVPDDGALTHISTVKMNGGESVYHVFEAHIDTPFPTEARSRTF